MMYPILPLDYKKMIFIYSKMNEMNEMNEINKIDFNKDGRK
jgi:hypothetical protein